MDKAPPAGKRRLRVRPRESSCSSSDGDGDAGRGRAARSEKGEGSDEDFVAPRSQGRAGNAGGAEVRAQRGGSAPHKRPKPKLQTEQTDDGPVVVLDSVTLPGRSLVRDDNPHAAQRSARVQAPPHRHSRECRSRVPHAGTPARQAVRPCCPAAGLQRCPRRQFGA